MGAGRFEFSLQPALDKAQARREECERALHEAQQQLRVEEERADALRAQISAATQRIACEDDKSSSAARGGAEASQMADRQAYRRRLCDELRSLEASLAERQREVEWARERVVLRRGAALEAANAVAGMERYRDAEERKFRKEQEKAAERERDDMNAIRARRPPN